MHPSAVHLCALSSSQTRRRVPVTPNGWPRSRQFKWAVMRQKGRRCGFIRGGYAGIVIRCEPSDSRLSIRAADRIGRFGGREDGRSTRQNPILVCRKRADEFQGRKHGERGIGRLAARAGLCSVWRLPWSWSWSKEWRARSQAWRSVMARRDDGWFGETRRNERRGSSQGNATPPRAGLRRGCTCVRQRPRS